MANPNSSICYFPPWLFVPRADLQFDPNWSQVHFFRRAESIVLCFCCWNLYHSVGLLPASPKKTWPFFLAASKDMAISWFFFAWIPPNMWDFDGFPRMAVDFRRPARPGTWAPPSQSCSRCPWCCWPRIGPWAMPLGPEEGRWPGWPGNAGNGGLEHQFEPSKPLFLMILMGISPVFFGGV